MIKSHYFLSSAFTTDSRHYSTNELCIKTFAREWLINQKLKIPPVRVVFQWDYTNYFYTHYKFALSMTNACDFRHIVDYHERLL